ncbi:MAG: hypothetical protein MUR51_08755 [Pseudomonadota bacterium]|nr:hypothetical protein [Pseudomonadota bacterium]
MARPQGLLEATMYANRLGIPVEEVITKIKDGTYIGRQVHGEWYLESPMVAVSTDNTSSQDVNTEPNESRYDDDVPTSYSMTRFLLKMSSFLGWILFLGGMVWLLSGFIMSDGIQDKLIKGGVAFLLGIAIIHVNQVILAVLDTSDNTLELLRVMRDK